MYFIRVTFLLLVISATFNYCIAGEPASYVDLPTDSQFQKASRQTSIVLRALILENSQAYSKAHKTWQQLPSDSTTVKEHLFMTGFVNLSEESFEMMVKTDRTVLLWARYLSWQRRWKQALDVMMRYQDLLKDNTDASLELIRLFLVLGDYESAEKSIEQFKDTDRRSLLQLKILTIWLNILQNQPDKALVHIQEVEEDYLYFPVPLFLQVDQSKEGAVQSGSPDLAILRFPSAMGILEELINYHKQSGNWKAIGDLLESQKLINKPQFSWLLIAEYYIQSGKTKELQKLIDIRKKDIIVPEFYDLLAQEAIKKGNWAMLKNVAKQYQELFPELLDGKLYEAIYFQKTGQKSKSDEILSEFDLL